jgi:hypothetical protein
VKLLVYFSGILQLEFSPYVFTEDIMTAVNMSTVPTLSPTVMRWLSQSIYDMAQVLFNTLHGKRSEIVEALLLAAVGPMFGADNVHQIAQRLQIMAESTLYRRLHGITLQKMRQMLHDLLLPSACQAVRDALAQSPAERTRSCVTLVLDDSVLKRFSKHLSYVWKWWSGQCHTVTKGQDLLGLVLVINGLPPMPVAVRLVSKQGKGRKSKPELALTMVEEFRTTLRAFGFSDEEIAQIHIVADSAFADSTMIAALRQNFTRVVIGGKSSFTFNSNGNVLKGKNLLTMDLDEHWRGHYTYHRLCATSPTFGDVVLVVYHDGSRPRYLMFFADADAQRGVQALRINQQRWMIEFFWRTLKTVLHIGKVTLQGREGAVMMLVMRVATFLLVAKIVAKLRRHNLTVGQVRFICQHATRGDGGYTLDQFHQEVIQKLVK